MASPESGDTSLAVTKGSGEAAVPVMAGSRGKQAERRREPGGPAFDVEPLSTEAADHMAGRDMRYFREPAQRIGGLFVVATVAGVSSVIMLCGLGVLSCHGDDVVDVVAAEDRSARAFDGVTVHFDSLVWHATSQG